MTLATLQPSFISKSEPPIKWAGGKRALVPRLRELYAPHQHRRMVVPFAGGLGDLLGVWPTRALINDVNPHLMNFYCWWQKGIDANEHRDIFKNDRHSYLENRRKFNELIGEPGGDKTKDAAVLFYYLLRTCFRGLCRFNSKGKFNVGYGEYAKINYNEWLLGYDLPDTWEFTQGDFSALKVHRCAYHGGPADYIYADPPYDGVFTAYSKGGFDWSDQQFLVSWLAPHEGPVAISNSATERIINLYTDFGYTIDIVTMPRMISSDGNRDSVPEVLATRNMNAR